VNHVKGTQVGYPLQVVIVNDHDWVLAPNLDGTSRYDFDVLVPNNLAFGYRLPVLENLSHRNLHVMVLWPILRGSDAFGQFQSHQSRKSVASH
jgi:hypothetical protein